MAQKGWFKYTDESGKCWRIQTTAEIAEIGGLIATDADAYPPLPDTIKPRYVWLQEWPRPKDRLSARLKVILERDRLKEIWGTGLSWQVASKEMMCASYYGEVVSA